MLPDAGSARVPRRRQCCPACSKPLTGNMDFGPPLWRSACTSCGSTLVVSVATRVTFVGLLLALVPLGYELGWPGARLIELASGGRLLLPPDGVGKALTVCAVLVFALSLNRFVHRFGILSVFDEVQSLRNASRVVLGVLVILLVGLAWVALRVMS